MKIYLKRFLTKSSLFLIAIFVLAVLVRFYNFSNRVTFWSEQARSLVTSADYLTKPSLLGQPYFMRFDTNGHEVFSGALFNYLLVPFLLVTRDPLVITVFFTLLNLFTGIFVYFVAQKIFGRIAGAFSFVLFLFNNYMIYHSLFIWSYNFLPLIGVLSVYFLYLQFKKSELKNIFVLGILSGVGISLQILYAPFAILTIILAIWKSRKKIKHFMFFILGLGLPNLPMIIFDLRHQFYNTKTIWQFFLDSLSGKSGAGFAYYYLLPLWPICIILAGFIVYEIWKRSKALALVVIILYLFFNIKSSLVNFYSPTGMPWGLTISDIDQASQAIAKDAKGNFNVSEVLDFDKQAYVLRYFIVFKYNKEPLGETEYQNLGLLYVLSQKEYNFGSSDIWEVNASGLKNVSKITNVGEGYAIYKLTK
jgi:hypothetical protein